MKIYQYIFSILLIISSISCYTIVNATCYRVDPYVDAGCDPCGVSPGFASLTLSNSYMQPVGTPLATSIFDFTTGVRYGNGDKVLYQCDVSDIGQIYEQVATNGDDRVGGAFDLGAIDGNPGYYATYFPYVGIKLTHLKSGTVFSRYWKSIPLTSYQTVGNKINIRVKDLSSIKADLIRLSSLPPTTIGSFCGGLASGTGASDYTCTQPNGYVLFVGPGVPGEIDGSDSATNYSTWGTGRWNAIGMGTSPRAAINYNGTCVARNVTPVVLFPTISDASLNAGNVVDGQLTVTVECDNDIVNNAMSSVIMGLQTSYSSFIAAQKLGLVNSDGGVQYLLSDEYDTDNTVAKGVGITLSFSATGTPMTFVGWTNCTATGCPSNITSGWYPLMYGAQVSDNSKVGYTSFTTQLTATLTKIPGIDVVPGKVKATAYVLVRIQ